MAPQLAHYRSHLHCDLVASAHCYISFNIGSAPLLARNRRELPMWLVDTRWV